MHIPALLQFLKELSENNNRPWFLHNKPTYDILREEFTELVADIIQRIAKFDERIEHVDPKKSLFRIYRDVRFSKNKEPYKTQFSAMIAEKKDHKAVPGYYFQINHQGILGMGGGVYMPEPETLNKIRHEVLARPEEVHKLLKNKRFLATYGGLSEEDRMMRAPKGYLHLPADHPMLDMIKNRHYFSFLEIDLNKHVSKNLAKEVAGNFEDLYPLIEWLRNVLEQ